MAAALTLKVLPLIFITLLECGCDWLLLFIVTVKDVRCEVIIDDDEKRFIIYELCGDGPSGKAMATDDEAVY